MRIFVAGVQTVLDPGLATSGLQFGAVLGYRGQKPGMMPLPPTDAGMSLAPAAVVDKPLT